MITKKFMQNIILSNSTSSQFGVSKNNGTPKWMVKIMENPIKHGMIWGGYPYFWKHPRKRCGLFVERQVANLNHFFRDMSLDIQNPPVIPGEDRCEFGTPKSRALGDVNGGEKTPTQ